ncbi:GL20220 [Drosophila persimilis]|uniref:GL20220 n=1 Tax=Drosophila persimilis TaxID=7234 RepID=B4GXR5_DROPE|nr:GL20220 [Drosophila persimilis]
MWRMSLTKKDPSLRVAASDPHLVSLGGGRLSTAVTIHYIHIGDTTIGSAGTCSISLNGSGVRPLHCTIYRSDANEVTLVPEQEARLLIDGAPILEETKLSQGAMITIGNSNYLRFNNPAEAQMMRSAMGSNERISMPQIDFTQSARQAHELSQSLELESFYESIINPIKHSGGLHSSGGYEQQQLECPKVFTSDLVTVNMPAKDVLGQKYASFARNLAENHRNEKQMNNQYAKGAGVGNNSGYWNVPTNAAIYKEQQQQQQQHQHQQQLLHHHQQQQSHPDLLTKVNNDRYDRYPKPGGFQIYSMNGMEPQQVEQQQVTPMSPRLQLQALQNRIRRLEAQRNATRVMEENQQAKLKQSIEMKQDQLKKLRAMLKQKPNNACLKEELQLVCESLESDRKTFEDLEFQYFEEESEHHASHEELKRQEQRLTLESELAALRIQLGPDDEEQQPTSPKKSGSGAGAGAGPGPGPGPASPGSSSSNLINGVMSQSLFGSAELLCPKRHHQEDLMSKSVNENMFYNHKIEATTSTPKRMPLQLYEDGAATGSGSCEQISFNLSLQSDRFEVNPLERRVPSQDDIDRICKVANDAPISTSQGASTKIFDSFKEIERNRKLLLAQQGHQVIEHERQKMYDLKKKCHAEARTQYLLSTQQSMEQKQLEQQLETDANGGKDAKLFETTELQKLSGPEADATDDKEQQQQQKQKEQEQKTNNDKENNGQSRKSIGSSPSATTATTTPQQQRHSQPELEHHALAVGLEVAVDLQAR